MYPNSIKNLIDCFKDLPGIGEKTAERLVFSLICFDKEKLTSFSDAIISVRDKLSNCSICGNITEDSVCNICSDSNRNSKIIFVVEKAKDIALFEKINIYNNTYNYLIWNYKGYINLNKNNNENIKIFNNENYSTLNTYQIDKYLIIPDYDSKYYFTKMYIFDTEKQLLNDISFDYEISYDLLYLGEVKNKLYFIDKKNKNEYYLNFKKLEIKKVKIKNDKIDIYENGEWNNQSIKDVINKNISFTFAQSYNYKIIDDNLYQIIDNHNIKISNQKITSIISSNENQVFYLVGTKLYCYNANGENLLLEYKEWKFNYLNQIFIFN